jgi:GAF domain-containing protein
MTECAPRVSGWIHDLDKGSFNGDHDMPHTLVAPQELATAMAGLARRLYIASSTEQVITRVLEACVELIDGCAHAGVSLVKARGKVETPVTTSPLARALDELQFELDEGPCLQAIRDDRSFSVPDLATDPRWSRYGPCAAELGARSMLVCRLFTDGKATAAITLYGTTPHAFSPADEDTAAVLAAHAAVAIDAARTRAQLKEAIRSRQVIGEAIGVLKERYDVSSKEAFLRLRAASQSLNIKLHVIAEHLASHTDAGEARR